MTEATYVKFGNKADQSLSLPMRLLDFRYFIASFRNQSALKSTRLKTEAKVLIFQPRLQRLGNGCQNTRVRVSSLA